MAVRTSPGWWGWERLVSGSSHQTRLYATSYKSKNCLRGFLPAKQNVGKFHKVPSVGRFRLLVPRNYAWAFVSGGRGVWWD
jgi:hypothetical protein